MELHDCKNIYQIYSFYTKFFCYILKGLDWIISIDAHILFNYGYFVESIIHISTIEFFVRIFCVVLSNIRCTLYR